MKLAHLNKAATTIVCAAAFAASPLSAQDADVNNSADETELEDAGSDEQEPQQADEAVPAPKAEKITDRSHPDFIRCRRERVMGSLAQRRKRCMTNREWAALANEGNKRANELVDEMRSTSVSNN